ncbi:MAG: glycoside hydrolase domain-containing protein, partial [Bryobacteraceae bacterium]
AFRCFNFGGVDWEGHPFSRTVNIAQGKIQAIWCGVQIPKDAVSGQYSTTIILSANGQPQTPVEIRLSVSPALIRNAGDDDPQRLSRLRWLDSTLAEDDGIVPPYTAVQVKGRSLGVLGRDVLLGDAGLPDRIASHFAIEMTGYKALPRQVLSAPIRMVIEDARHHILPWSPGRLRFTKKSEGSVAWEVPSQVGPLSAHLRGEIEFDGSLNYAIDLTARATTDVADIRLEIPLAADVARYAMGLGLRGGTRPDHFEWRWQVEHNQDGAWIGDVNAGLQFSLRDDRYSRPLNTNFYLSKPLIMPASWDNGGKGGCRLAVKYARTYLVTCFSGARRFAAGETQHYNLRLLVTPFHTLDTSSQWRTRFYHAYQPLSEIAATGATVVNIHHATPINPFINYPFLRPKEMKAYIDEAHARGMKVKIYDTVRELTNHAPELFALLSLGDEVIARGPGGGPSWLQEHIDRPYIPGWYVPALHDAALVTTGTSRWLNFYVEGLRWLVENVGIDGLYLDDIAFDRTTMKRVRKVLLRGNPGALIDVHSANQFNPRDGYANSANLYLEQFPFIDRLWFGEYFDYNSQPDFWLVEISGIPYGLMGEMLQDGGNPWRGMVYGMTNRLPWAGDPRPIWRFWDQYKIENTEMIGYWVPNNPVKTGRSDILASTYRGKGQTLVSLASWAKAPAQVKLQIDWRALGINPAKATIEGPAIEKFQEARSFQGGEPIPVEPGKGWLLVISQR